MPSPVSARRVGEWLLRVLSLAILVVLAMRSWDGAGTWRSRLHGVETVTQADIARALPRWSVAAQAPIHLVLDSVLPGEQRDWLAAIEHTGTPVTWTSSHVAATAATLSRVADPAGMSEFAATVPAGTMAVVHDKLGPVDTARTGASGMRLQIPGIATRVGVSVGGTTAWAVSRDSIVFKRLLVEGAASWETKYTIAALAERGWKIDAVTHVAPGVDVREGNPVALDTSRYAAAIAIDSTASLIARGAGAFVRSGGGLITLHDASGIGPATGRVDQIVLERKSGGGGDDEVRAARVGPGRVIRIGYKDLWRLRLADNDTIADPAAAHRAWLAKVVASVAYAPRVALAQDSAATAVYMDADPAPLADMVSRIGHGSGSVISGQPLRHAVSSAVLFGILLASLLLELASRRLRGAL